MQQTFTSAQRTVLANQVTAFKIFRESNKKQIQCVLPDNWMPMMSPVPLDGTGPTPQKLADEEIARFRAAMAPKVSARQQQQQPQAQRQSPQNNTSNRSGPSNGVPPQRPVIQQRDVALTTRPDSLFTIHSYSPNMATPTTGGVGYLEDHLIEVDMAGLIRAERQRLVDQALRKKAEELEVAVRNSSSADPGMKYRSGSLPLGAALLQLRMLRALGKQRELRAAIDAEGREIHDMTDKQYRMLKKTCRSTLIENARKEIATKGEIAAGRVRDIKTFMSEGMKEINQGVKDLRVTRNRGMVRAHERLARERNRLKEDDRSMRMAALKAHDFQAYREMLQKQTGGTPGADEKYAAIDKFLADTEAYLNRLASKIASVKVTAEASSAAARAMAEARARGLSEDEVHAAAHAAAAEAATGSEALHAATEGAMDAQSRYYALAHSNTEEIVDQPRLLRPPNNARLREYQIVGLQWMVSLYNNHLNGILADEMGLGKTVQVMALIAYLMEKKANYGPHLIIVPNAVMVNWKSELTQWLPSARCVYYVGGKDERARKYVTEVQPLQFNVLVTTYEFIMRDRAKLSKIDWQYIVIDEAQRMKDRESKLAKDLDRFTAARRILLSGTPLQNDLIELWSLLNLLLPDVFDDKKVFSEWFGDTVGGSSGAGGGDDWLAKEKRVVVIHRLHQILEPFMLRRQVEDVESKLPPKTAYTIRVPMSALQSVVYTWVKTTGTLRLDPNAPTIGRVHREFASLNNKCMELRKLCNHPLLSYPPSYWGIGDAIVRQCGKPSGHRVLLFSTMTKLLDLLEVYLQWRQLPASIGGGTMKYLRIDGSTALEDREKAIQNFNAPNSEAFVFLLSIRAAGRGLNLQSSDTVVIYDPDPNPKNEEQAIARSHRIGQTKEVRVFHMEAVVDAAPVNVAAGIKAATPAAAAPEAPPPPAPLPAAAPVPAPSDGTSPDKIEVKLEVERADELLPAAEGNGVVGDGEIGSEKGAQAAPGAALNAAPTAAPAPPIPSPSLDPNRRLYGDSIESVMRNQIQRMKIEMANEVIDAGRFDQQTTMAERRETLETLLQDQDRGMKAVNDVPTNAELNVMIARSDDEMKLFEKLDAEPGNWFNPTTIDEVPYWMRWTERDLRAALEENAKHKVDIEAEMAALTGMVHHAAAEAKAAKAPAAAPVKIEAPEVRRPRPVIPAEPTMTTTTTRSMGREEDEEEEVGMVDNDDEEEEILGTIIRLFIIIYYVLYCSSL